MVNVITVPSGGGAEFLVRELTRRLPDLGVPAYAVYFLNPKGVALGATEKNLELGFRRSPGAVPKLRETLMELRKKHDKLIVHAHLTPPFFYVPVAARGLGCRLIYTEHNTYNKRRRIPFFNVLEKRIYDRFEKIITISAGTRRTLLDWVGRSAFQSRVQVIYNGARLLSLADPCRRPSEKGIRLISVGSLTRKKGFDLALRALEEVRCPVEKYVIVGRGPEDDSLRKQVEESGLSDVVEFAGWRDDIESLLHWADLQVIPSRWEGFGLVAVEGLSTGLPMVATNVDGLNEVLHDCPAARLVEPENPSALAKGIDFFHQQGERRHLLTANARNRAEMYGLDSMINSYLCAYHEIAGW